MGLEAMTVPSRSVGSKYDFTPEEVEQAHAMVTGGEQPGEGGYESVGKARSAALRLIEQIAEAFPKAPEIGSRVWSEGEGDGERWSFALKLGKREATNKGSE